MIKVCMLVPNLDRTGGYEKQAISLTCHLKKRGLDVFILTNQCNGKLPELEKEGEIVIHRRLPPSPDKKSINFRLKMLWSLLLFMYNHRNEFDIIHSHALTSTAILSVIISKLLGKKSIIKIATEGDITRLIESRRLKFKSILLLLRFANTCVSLSTSIERELASVGVPRKKILSTFNGVDTERFYPLSEENSVRLKRTLSLEGSRTVIFVGRLVPRKGADLLLGAWAKVIDNYPDTHLLIVGFGKEESRLRSLCSDLGLDKDVSFLGEITNIEDYMKASDIFVIPSRLEGNPNTLLEASSSGLPIVASSISGIEEVIDDGVNGLLFPVDEEDALADRIITLLNDRDLCSRLGKNARENALSRFSFASVGQRYIDLYRYLLNDN